MVHWRKMVLLKIPNRNGEPLRDWDGEKLYAHKILRNFSKTKWERERKKTFPLSFENKIDKFPIQTFY